MSNIIQFPTKENYIERNLPDVPLQIRQCVSAFYDDIVEQSNNLPAGIINQPEYKAIIVNLIEQLLQEKTAVCLLKYELSKQ